MLTTSSQGVEQGQHRASVNHRAGPRTERKQRCIDVEEEHGFGHLATMVVTFSTGHER
jgi:hypothetical protein